MQQTDRFASKILPEYLLVVKELKLKGIVLTRRKMFQKSALDAELKGSDKFRNIIKQIDADEDLKGKIANVLNQMEAMAMVFVGGVGDEEFVFSSLCNIFCTIVEEYWFFIAVNRKDDGTIKLYENLVKLHSIWSGRAEKTSINAKIQDLLIRKGGIEDKKVVPIGL